MMGGRSMELTTGWDFSRRVDRRKALETVIGKKPKLIVGSLPCTMFSVLHGLNVHGNKSNAEWMAAFEKKEEAVEHIKFRVNLYRLRKSEGR